MKQHEAVIEAMKQNGGYATLGRLYQTVLKIPDCKWGTKTPFASIRRIVQTHPEFFKVKPGLWALSAEKQRVRELLGAAKKPGATRIEEFSHTYYQGLIVEVGNLSGYETFVPNQDKNRTFLNQKLGNVVSVAQYYDFTYDSLLKRAKTVDVTWFNGRRLPNSFFEIEHSTDIQNSLLKFLEFQDFRIRFFIVADAVRQQEFVGKLAYAAFAPLRSQVRFLDYDTLAEWHTKMSASAVFKDLLTP